MSHRFLIVRLGSLGDVIHAIPTAAALRVTVCRMRIEGTIVEAWSEHFPGRGDHLCINLLGAAGERYTFAIPMPLASGERLLPERVLGQRFAIEYGTDGGGSTPSMLPFAVEPDADN